ncbi:MAG TPA: helix-turn-helix domain-containing protein, partial [Ilumatobacteraceae bacterium]|nr:helix-turn-helix domain-containing protein [Ilumatobacteraceae bacterium]
MPDQDVLRQSRALGDPTRYAVFAYLRDAPGGAGVAELTEHFGLNHNAIRQHLAKLVAASLVGALSEQLGDRPVKIKLEHVLVET